MTATEAWSYVRAKWDEFTGLYPRLLDLQHRAAVAAAEARQAGRVEEADEARASLERLAELVELHDDAVSRFEILAAAVGLGAFPIAYAAAALALAGIVALVFARFGAEARIVGLLEQGRLTPGEAERILAETEGGTGLFSGLRDAVTWIAVGLAAWWFVQAKGRGE